MTASASSAQADTTSVRGRRPGVPLGQLFGFPLYLHLSTLLFAALVTISYGSFLAAHGYTFTTAYAAGAGFVVLLVLSVLLHELGHAFTARAFGIGVRSITLELLGGATAMVRPASRPRVEALIAAAGPGVSLVLGALAALAAALLPAGGITYFLAVQLAFSNLIVGIFNSLPGLPLDGGRVLGAAVWAATGKRHRGTTVAAWTGRVVALATAIGAWLLADLGLRSAFGLAFTVMVALTLWQGAGQALRQARAQQQLATIDLAKLSVPLAVVPSGTTLADAFAQLAASDKPQAVLAVGDADGRILAIVDDHAAQAVPDLRHSAVTVDTVARALSAIPVLPSTASGIDVLSTVQASPANQYLVTTGEDVLGVLRVADLAALFDTKRE